mgnify:CR=1 FL=1
MKRHNKLKPLNKKKEILSQYLSFSEQFQSYNIGCLIVLSSYRTLANFYILNRASMAKVGECIF